MIYQREKHSSKSLLILAIILISFTGGLYSSTAIRWEIIDFEVHGTRRIIELEESRWFFYRPVFDEELILTVPGGKIMIKSAVRDGSNNLSYQVRIGNSYRNFNVKSTIESGDFLVMEDIFLNFGQGEHTLRINTQNRLAYFKVFVEKETWDIPMIRSAFEPDKYEQNLTLKSSDTESPYFTATPKTPLEFRVKGPNEITGFMRVFVDEQRASAQADVYINSRLSETLSVPRRYDDNFTVVEQPERALSRGRRVNIQLGGGDHLIKIVPHSDNEFVFRLFMDVPEFTLEIDEKEEVSDLSAFKKESIISKRIKDFKLNIGSAFRYNSNVFSLSEYDIDRFDNDSGVFPFISSRDDLIVNPYLKMRYPINIGKLTMEPFINANYYYYASNNDKSNFSVLAALFNSIGSFNFNFYYGYYGDLYVRDYTDKDGTGELANFEYEKNLYRIYSYFSLGKNDRPLLYYQIEDYFHNEFFTEYDGRATTYGLGWRRTFPTFYLRLFYYYRQYEGTNIDYDIDNISFNEEITDPSYESNIYDIQFRNKMIDLVGAKKFRPFFGFRFEDRYFSTKLPVSVSLFQSTRNDKRYRLNAGVELYLIENTNIILDYRYFIRDSHSDNPSVSRLKDYNQQSISLDLEYTFSF